MKPLSAAHTAGIDEVGRGCLFGPVVAAAVILPAAAIPRLLAVGLTDSKKLGASQRERLNEQIREQAIAYALGLAGVAEIDRINILQASLLAMERAVLRLPPRSPRRARRRRFIPAFRGVGRLYRAEPVIDGDNLLPEISAASILAKVCRDRLMRRLHRRYPQYGFDENKGYATAAHLRALAGG
ncbi:MAG: ribonuclease HII, partial [Synechococcales cyanobacterium RU_4_20]|nr:ribonuclease HII [Synechococcales cyanobacterium RU_4_20]